MKEYPFFKQLDAKDCGPTVLRMISKYYGRNYNLNTLSELSNQFYSAKIEEYSLGDNSELYKFNAIYGVNKSNFTLKKRKLHM